VESEQEHFKGADTRWSMDLALTWLPPDGDVSAPHIETLGNMISEAFHLHKANIYNAKAKTKNADAKQDKHSSTAVEASEWNEGTSVRGTDFLNTKT